jgi:Chaperone of endosialidase
MSHAAPMGPPPPPPSPPSPPAPSDVRLKTDVREVGTTAHDLPLYQFSYIGKDGRYEGVMAQDVLKVMPEAVSVGEDGYYRVSYDLLGIEMRRLD